MSSQAVPDSFLNRLVSLGDYAVLAQMNVDTDLHLDLLANQLGSTSVPSSYREVAYNTALAKANVDWAAKLNHQVLKLALLHLQAGFRTTIDLKGWSIGAICFLLCEGNPRNVMTRLHGLFFSGTVRTFESVPVYQDMVPASYLGRGVYTEDRLRKDQFITRAVTEKRIVDVPLWKVRWYPIESNGNYSSPYDVPTFPMYLFEINDLEGGSDVAVMQSQSDCFILRRFPAQIPSYIDKRVRVIRTGGLSQLLTEDKEFVVNDFMSVFCPSGEMTCIFSAFAWAYVKCFTSRPSTIEGSASSFQSAIRVAASIVNGFEDDWIRRQLRKSSICKTDREANAIPKTAGAYLRFQRKFQKMGVVGLTNEEFRRFMTHCAEKFNCIVMMVYLKPDRRKGGDYRLGIRNESYHDKVSREQYLRNQKSIRSGSTPPFPPTYVTLFQCTYEGRLFRSVEVVSQTTDSSTSSCRQEADVVDGTTIPPSSSEIERSGSLHAIACYPPIAASLVRGELTAEATQKLVGEIEDKLVQHFQSVADFAKIGMFLQPEKSSYAHIKHLVEFQQSRFEQNRSKPTLIFSETGKGEEAYSASQFGFDPRFAITMRQKDIYDKTSDPIVFAYDIETVTYDQSVKPDQVDPRFVHNFSEMPHSLPRDLEQALETTLPSQSESEAYTHGSVYGPSNCQIPFSCQFVQVNLSDTGLHLQKKNSAMVSPLRYESEYNEHELRLRPEIPPFPADMRLTDYILSPPQTVYGGRLLGACIDEMLYSMACKAASQGSNSVYAYAHNGCGFDAFIVMQYTSYHFVKVLKTSRGVLSATIQVFVLNETTNENTSVRIHLRDTKVHVPGSLRALCKGFNVPNSWCKTDFPIYLIKASNCYDPRISSVLQQYGENDVLCLAYIMRKMNDLICDSNWHPASIATKKPPLTQFLTCMSMIKKATLNHFAYEKRIPFDQLPKAVDVVILRNFIKRAMIGGRVNAYAKTYMSHNAKEVYETIPINFKETPQEELLKLKQQRQVLYQKVIADKDYSVCLDVTSLYPFVQSYCPMPTGKMMMYNAQDCDYAIRTVGCAECLKAFTLCPTHRLAAQEVSYPFLIVLVENLRFPTENKFSSHDPHVPFAFRNMCARKYKDGLVYSLEQTIPGDPTQVHSFSHVDLFWMRRQGFLFNILCGFGWSTSFLYNSFIVPAFQERIEAKRAGNKLLSNFKKLGYNGSYGVTTQADIEDNWFLITLPVYLKDDKTLSPKDPRLISFILAETDGKVIGPDDEIDDFIHLPNDQTMIRLKKISACAESFSDLSPMQLGVAVTAYARHIMNLVMFGLDPYHMTYTDTDSITVSAHAYELIKSRSPFLICEDVDAPLGSLKNDHGEDNGTNPVIITSLIGTKKVKMHITLNAEGDVKVFNTYKGLNPTDYDEASLVRMHPDFVEQKVSLALLDIAFRGIPREMAVSHWKRKMSTGVEISSFVQKAESRTYFNFAVGTHFVNAPHGLVEFFIPNGISTTDPLLHSYCFNVTPFMFDTVEQSFSFHPDRLSDDFFVKNLNWRFPPSLLYSIFESSSSYFFPNASQRALVVDDEIKSTVEYILSH